MIVVFLDGSMRAVPTAGVQYDRRLVLPSQTV